MKPNFAIMRTDKLKRANLGGSTSHIARTRDTPNANSELTPNNEIIAGVEAKQALQVIRERLNEVEAQSRKKVRKDATVAIESVLTASPEWFEGKTPEQVKEWSKANVAWLEKTYKAENIVSATLHLDESTPHIHALVFPEAEKGRLNASHWLDGRQKLSEMQDSYAEAMQEFELERGVKGSKAKHVEIKKWYTAGLQHAKKEVDKFLDIAKNLKGYLLESWDKTEMWHVKDDFQAEVCENLKKFESKELRFQDKKIQEMFKECYIDFVYTKYQTYFTDREEWFLKFKEVDENFATKFKENMKAPEIKNLSLGESPVKIKKKEIEIGDW